MRQEMIHWKREKTLQNVTPCDSRRPREGTKSLICKLALLVGMPSCYNKITPWIQYATQLSSLYSTIIYQEISMSWQIIWHCIGAGNWSFKLLPTRNFKVQEKKKIHCIGHCCKLYPTVNDWQEGRMLVSHYHLWEEDHQGTGDDP